MNSKKHKPIPIECVNFKCLLLRINTFKMQEILKFCYLREIYNFNVSGNDFFFANKLSIVEDYLFITNNVLRNT